MSIIDYKDIVDAVVAKIESYSEYDFTYTNKWIDNEGKILASSLNNKFNVFINKKFINEFGSHDQNMLNIGVEFILTQQHDYYLTILGHCEAAIYSLGSIKNKDLLPRILRVFECEKLDEYVRVIFPEVNYLV